MAKYPTIEETMPVQVVVVGAGFGGLEVVQQLRDKVRGTKRPIKVTIIDKTNHHLFQPLLYQVATAALSPSDIAYPIREVVAKKKHVECVLGEVTAISTERRFVEVGCGERFHYDYLVVATGGRHSYFGNDKWEVFAPGLKTIDDAIHIRNRILLAYEKAERLAANGMNMGGCLNFVIVGGGPTGVEVAGAIAEIAHKTLLKSFRHINPRKTRVIVVESAKQVLAQYPPKLGKAAQESLEKLKVEVILGTRVVDISPKGVTLSSGVCIATDTIVWAAGNVASPLVAHLDTPLEERSKRAIVRHDWSIPSDDRVFVIGDAALFTETSNGKPLPGVVQVAMQGGDYVANVINNDIPFQKRKKFWYFDKGNLATIGRAHAVGDLGFLHISGILAWLIWAVVHVWFLVNFRSRIIVSLQWLFLYISGGRGSRIINVRSEDDFNKAMRSGVSPVPPKKPRLNGASTPAAPTQD